jgi:hypothetical protein
MKPVLLILTLLALLNPTTLAQAETVPPSAPSDAQVTQAIGAAIRHLLSSQEDYDSALDRARPRPPKKEAAAPPAPPPTATKVSGAEWPYEGVYRVGNEIPPGYRVGGTAIVAWALIDSPGFDQDQDRKAAVERARRFTMTFLQKEPLLQSGFLGSYDVRGWAHTYGLWFLLRLIERNLVPDAEKSATKALVESLIKTLSRTDLESVGGWNYSRGAKGLKDPRGQASPFMTAPTLLALYAAKQQGFSVPAVTVDRALQTLEAGRSESGAWVYAIGPKGGRADEPKEGACARMAAAELALYLGGRGSVDALRGAVQAFFDHWEWLEKRRKKGGTHEPPYGVAPYYFHFGHTYAALAIEQLPEAERPAHRSRLRELYWRTKEGEGVWNDRVFDRSSSFGSAMAMIGLQASELPRLPRWK